MYVARPLLHCKRTSICMEKNKRMGQKVIHHVTEILHAYHVYVLMILIEIASFTDVCLFELHLVK